MLNNIESTKFYINRQSIIELSNDEEEYNVRKPSTEAAIKDKSMLILQKRAQLLETIQQGKTEIWQYVKFGAIKEDGSINTMVLDKKHYTATQKMLANALVDLKKVDQTIGELDSISAGYYKDVGIAVDQAKRQVAKINQELTKTIRLDDEYHQKEEKQLEKALADAEKDLKLKMDVLVEQNSIYATVNL